MAADPAFSNLTYAGEHYAEVFGPAVIDPAGLVDNDLATAIDRTEYKQTINEFDDTVVFQTPAATFNDQSTTGDIDEVNLTVVPYEFHKQLEWSTIYTSWMNQRLAPGALNDYSPTEVTDMFIREVYVPKMKQAQANLVLNGKTALDATVGSYTFAASYTGLYGLFNASSTLNKLATPHKVLHDVVKGTTTILKIDGTTSESSFFPGNTVSIRDAAGTGWSLINVDAQILSVTNDGTDTLLELDVDSDALTTVNYTGDSGKIYFINRSNIFSVLANHLTRIPVAVRRMNPKIVLPTDLEYEWQFANAENASNINSQGYLSSYQMQMIDKQIVIMDNAPANTVGSWSKERVFYGFDLADDVANVRLTWMGDTTNDDVYRLKARMKTGVAITTKFPGEITLTTPDV